MICIKRRIFLVLALTPFLFLPRRSQRSMALLAFLIESEKSIAPIRNFLHFLSAWILAQLSRCARVSYSFLCWRVNPNGTASWRSKLRWVSRSRKCSILRTLLYLLITRGSVNVSRCGCTYDGTGGWKPRADSYEKSAHIMRWSVFPITSSPYP